jgi:hypothetical protein
VRGLRQAVGVAPVPAALREHFLTALLAAWPERDVSESAIRSQADLSFVEDEEGLAVRIRLLGYDLVVGVDDEANLRSQLDELAVHLAYNAEGDRWVGGDGWREYRP